MPHDKVQYLVLDRRDPGANMARLYVLSIETSLFGDVASIQEWGGSELLGSEDGAMEALAEWLHRKQRRGYVAQSGGR
jgi:predicted DNA-binding WGR domain protein